MAVGQTVAFGDRVALRPGNVTTLDQIPEGTQICNVEARPGDGGKIARSGGNSATIDTRMDGLVRVRLPSGQACGASSARRAGRDSTPASARSIWK